MLAAALGAEAVLAAKRTKALAVMGAKASAAVYQQAERALEQCHAWAGERLAAGA